MQTGRVIFDNVISRFQDIFTNTFPKTQEKSVKTSATEKVKGFSRSISSTLTQIWNGVPENEKRYFMRKEGYWNKELDERRNDFFGKLMVRESQREDWYKVSNYVAEFWCAVSNLGFIYVGVQNNSPELIFAGCASIASHTVPKQWLLTVDKIGALVAVSKLFREYETIATKPLLVVPSAIAGTVFVMDIYLAQVRAKTWPHVTWHLTAAFMSDIILKSIKQ